MSKIITVAHTKGGVGTSEELEKFLLDNYSDKLIK
jgi:hypothetical protein